jgi:[ribosomal protein S5]-alanine N-acetyltransferase
LKAPEKIETARLVLQRPLMTDIEPIFSRYACDPEVTRFMFWPTHKSLADTKEFIAFSDEEWRRWPAGPYLVSSRDNDALLGGAGLAFETPYRASAGYVLAQDAWGKGYATEALRAMVETARTVGVKRLYAVCHTENSASRHVLEKGGFLLEGTLRRHTEFPNLQPGEPADVFCYAIIL